MEIINSISIPVLENLVVTDVVNRTQLKVKFDVTFNHDGTPNEDAYFKRHFGFKIEILGYPNVENAPTSATSRQELETHLFYFERSFHRWIPNSNPFGSGGFWGDGRLVRTISEMYNLSGEPNLDGPSVINNVTYVNQEVVSQEIETDLLDVNPATIGIQLPSFFGGGVWYNDGPDTIFARITIVEKRTRTIVGTKDSAPLKRFF